MSTLVTIGIPVYHRLRYLPGALRSVAAQNYPNIELIVSDNGANGSNVPEIVAANYSRPYRFRQNPSTVPLPVHFNQLLHEATGDYFVMLADDDEISPNYVSELAGLLDRHPEASLAVGSQEILDENGRVIRRTKGRLPEVLPGPDFFRAAFHTYEYGFECFMTFLVRTAELRRFGGYPHTPMGNAADDAVLLKLCLDRSVVLSHRCSFRYRIYQSSYGLSVSLRDLAEAIRRTFLMLDSDPDFRPFAAAHPADWAELKRYLVENKLATYHVRWRDIYRTRLNRFQWVKAAFAFRYSRYYYSRVISTLLDTAANAVTARLALLARAGRRLSRRLTSRGSSPD
jgi:glycosyltransferase involved in cell wall biosynthesis